MRIIKNTHYASIFHLLGFLFFWGLGLDYCPLYIPHPTITKEDVCIEDIQPAELIN